MTYQINETKYNVSLSLAMDNNTKTMTVALVGNGTDGLLDKYEQFATLSVFVEPMRYGFAAIDTHTWPEAESFLQKNGLGKPVGFVEKNGIRFPVYSLRRCMSRYKKDVYISEQAAYAYAS